MNQTTFRKAEIILRPQQFQVSGPALLVMLLQDIISQKTSPEQMKDQIDELFEKWYVACSVTGEPISLRDLRYWNIERNEVYVRPEVMPEYWASHDVDFTDRSV